jgi:BRCA1-associated protein
MLAKAVDKASSASKAAEAAALSASTAISQMAELQVSHDSLKDELAALSKDRDRLAQKVEKSNDLARNITAKWQEEKKVGEGLLSRVNHMTEMVGKLRTEIREAKEESADLKEQNRDLSFFISSSEKVKQVEGELGEEIKEGTLSVPEPKAKGKGKGRGK